MKAAAKKPKKARAGKPVPPVRARRAARRRRPASRKIYEPKSELLPYQQRWVDDGARWKFGLMSRQVGKDFASGYEGIRDILRAEKAGGKRDWLIAAPSERQSLESLGKWKDWVLAFKASLKGYTELREGTGSESLLKSATITFPGGSRVIAVPGRPDTARGYSANVLLTEFAFFENPDLTWRAILPSITNPLRGGVKKVRLIKRNGGLTAWSISSNIEAMETAKNVAAIVYYLLGIVSLALAIRRPTKQKTPMTDNSPPTNTASTPPQSNKSLLVVVFIYLLFGAILTGLFWNQAHAYKAELDGIEANAFRDLPASHIVDNKHFVNEEVVLDDFKYINCTFDHCKMKYLGTRPVQAEFDTFDHCIWFSPRPEINQWMVACKELGLLKEDVVWPLEKH